jgi:23S rRNA (uridine2552-2'-O)-methyltransferase
MCVLDLGAAPGSWTLFIAGRVGPSGRVIAVDRAPMTIPLPHHAIALHMDALAVVPAELLSSVGRSGFDVAVSDMAPRTSGHRFVDQSRSFALFSRALEISSELVKPGGHFVGKIFQGEDFDQARKQVSALYEQVRIIRPKSVRSESYEIYLVGLSRREGYAAESSE